MLKHIIVRETAEEVAKDVAKAIKKLIEDNKKANKPTVLGLATGSTPEPLYKELVRMHKEEHLDCSSVITFNLDEYLGLPADHEQSYSHFMHHHLFDHVNIKEENIHMLDGTVPSHLVDQHVKTYEQLIEKNGGIDLQILGLGLNGHIGFNEPGSATDSKTRLVDLDDKTREANKRFFKSKDDVPTSALSMGIGTILEYSKMCFLLATGSSKADIISSVVASPKATLDIPATALNDHKKVIVLLDRAAASKLDESLYEKPSITSNTYASFRAETKTMDLPLKSMQEFFMPNSTNN